MKNFTLALCQILVEENKEKNLKNAEKMVREAHQNGANVIALPEMFNCPYANKFIKEFAEEETGETVKLLSTLSKELGITLIGGSIPEKDKVGTYNTSFSFDENGKIIGKHRKIHLFDIDIKGGVSFKESDAVGRGERSTVIESKFGKIGIAICYDMRFPELIRKMTLEGAELIVVPAAFSMSTGPSHWELTIKARALDNQIYFAAVSPARNLKASYHAYGYSSVASPWGDLVATTDYRENIVYANLDFEYLHSIREQLPLLKHRVVSSYE